MRPCTTMGMYRFLHAQVHGMDGPALFWGFRGVMSRRATNQGQEDTQGVSMHDHRHGVGVSMGMGMGTTIGIAWAHALQHTFSLHSSQVSGVKADCSPTGGPKLRVPCDHSLK